MFKAGYVMPMLALVVTAIVPFAPVQALDDDDTDELGAAAVARFLRQNLPERLDDLHYVLEEGGPEAYAEALNDARGLVEDYQHFRDLDPALGEVFLRSQRLDHRIGEVAQRVWEAEDDAARTAARADLRAVVAEQFDLDLQLGHAEVSELERGLEDLRRELREHQARRDALVEEEVNDILSDDDDDNEEDDD